MENWMDGWQIENFKEEMMDVGKRMDVRKM